MAAPLAAALCAVLPLAAGPAHAAGARCTFTLECVDAEPCVATDYALTLALEGFEARLDTPARTLEGRAGLTPSGATFVVATAAGEVHLLTLMDPAGTARYTAHLAGAGLAITYHGACVSE